MPRTNDAVPEHHRRSIRLRGFDYTSHGAYFVTIVTDGRRQLFGRIIGDEMRLNAAGRIVADEWQRSGELRSNVEIDAFVVMPNHVHGIVFLLRHDEGTLRSAPTSSFGSIVPGSLPIVVRNFKGAVTRRLRAEDAFDGEVWQRNYHERVIRNERELQAIRQYIIDNPRQWALDKENPRGQC
jgi:REP element-mobilizing transposase RayT